VDQDVDAQFPLFESQSGRITNWEDVVGGNQADMEATDLNNVLLDVGNPLVIEFSANNDDIIADCPEIVKLGLDTNIASTEDLVDLAGLEVVAEDAGNLVGFVGNVEIADDENKHWWLMELFKGGIVTVSESDFGRSQTATSLGDPSTSLINLVSPTRTVRASRLWRLVRSWTMVSWSSDVCEIRCGPHHAGILLSEVMLWGWPVSTVGRVGSAEFGVR
jgi:hypothetical protein